MFEPVANALVTARYRLVREIGRGGMGSVWEAHDIELDAPCALKFILNQDSKPPEVRLRFLREARAVARLHSPHAVGVRGVGEWEGALFIAMELLIGETLFSRLARGGPLSAAETSRVVEQLASVLTMAHRTGFVHRDLKPENIWLCGDEAESKKTRSSNQLIVKLLDFGVAKQVLDGDPLLKTASGLLVGTPYYMSPEQAGNRHVDYHSDLWSLAVIAVECLTGTRLYEAPALYEILDKIVRGPVPKLEELYPLASPALVAWWSRATSKVPQERHTSALELADEFSASLLTSSPATERTTAGVPTSHAPTSALPASVDPKRGPMTLTTPGTALANPWIGTASNATTESVGPLSSTQGHGLAKATDERSKAGPSLRFAWLVALAAGLAGSAWWVALQSADSDEVTEPTAATTPVDPQRVSASGPPAPRTSPAPEASATRLPLEVTVVAPTEVDPNITTPSVSALPQPSANPKTTPASVAKPNPASLPTNTYPTPKATPAVQPKPQAPAKPSRSGL